MFGYARSKMTDEELRDMVSRTLTCRIDKRFVMSMYCILVKVVGLTSYMSLLNNNEFALVLVVMRITFGFQGEL